MARNSDSPYLLSTRQMHGAAHYYRHEMTDSEHEHLLDQADLLQGMAVISGYASELYQDKLAHWHSYSTQSVITAGRGSGQRTEMVWVNEHCHDALHRDIGPLFELL